MSRVDATLAMLLVAILSVASDAQDVQPPFDAVYAAQSLGPVPGLPTPYGGLVFLAGNPNTLLIGGAASTTDGVLYSIQVARDSSGNVTGFVGTAEYFAEADYIDGGLDYGPGGVLFASRYPVSEIGQILPGSTVTDKVVFVSTGGSIGGTTFVPPGFPSAGDLKIVSYISGQFLHGFLTPDGSGTYDIDLELRTTIVGGPEGFVYIPPGSPSFVDYESMLVTEYSTGAIAAYRIDANGDPIPATRQLFVTGLTGAEGAALDPVSGAFMFSTFGGGDQVVLVSGFTPPNAVFIRGDGNSDGAIDIADPVYNLSYQFLAGPSHCLDAQDTNDDGQVNIADAVYNLSYLFVGGPAPSAPFPSCGLDPTPDAVSCVDYRQCP